jgi:hypothetical protein
MLLKLTYESEKAEKRTLIAPGLDFVAGSDRRCGLVLDEDLVEPRHARFFCLLGAWWVEPACTTAMLRVGRKRIREAVPLHPGVPVRLGGLALVPDFRLRFQDRAEPDGETAYSAERAIYQPAGLSEHERIQILAAISGALHHLQGQATFEALTLAMCEIFPAASAAVVLVYRDGELFPIASAPQGPAEVSFTLARRAALAGKGLVWESAVASASSRGVESLAATTTAVYAPVFAERKLLGILALTSCSLHSPLTVADLNALLELARIVARAFDGGVDALSSIAPSTFVSYARSDQDVAGRIAGFLRRHGFSVWMDDRLQIGQDWRDELARAIDAASSMTVLLSHASLESAWVQWEVDTARAAGKRILPVLTDTACDLPQEWKRTQYIRYEKDSLASMSKLLESLSRIVGAANGNRT